jgi:deoxyribodipyrimidine photolyase-related protein
MTTAGLVYPHQLFEHSPATIGVQTIYLVEDPLFFSQYTFHRQKLMLHRASMKRFANEQAKGARKVRYVEASELRESCDIGTILKKEGVAQVRCVDPEDDFLTRRISRGCRQNQLALTFLKDPHFLTSTDDMESFVEGKQKLFFTHFYIEQRKRLKLLVDGSGKPEGGKWSFDTENRKKLPKHLDIPSITYPAEDDVDREARRYVESSFPNAWGPNERLLYPSSRQEAKRWLSQFIRERLRLFGDYEDAIAAKHKILFHACITPALNIGLLSPSEVVDAVLQVPDLALNSKEGFVRQVIGWREFVRLVYRSRGSVQRTTNYWGHHRKLPSSFYDATTGIPPIDCVIQKVLDTGYCHHIERLMILGNLMLLCEFQPDEVYRWFMEMFIDAYDWVMVPNVYGMSQHADGGIMTTKPYISGSSYVLKMSDFARGEWCSVWDGLYWNFMDKHRSFFEQNPRMSVMTKQLDKMGDKLSLHKQRASDFLQSLERSS